MPDQNCRNIGTLISGGTAHTKARIARGLQRAQENYDPRPDPDLKTRSTASSGRMPRSTLDRRLHLRAHRNGNGLCRLCYRRLRSEDHRMTRLNLDANQLCPRRPQLGHLQTISCAGLFDPPLGPACNMCLFDTPNGLPKSESTCRSEAFETATTTHWPKPSSGCSKPRSSNTSARGKPKASSNGRLRNGYNGTTKTGCMA